MHEMGCRMQDVGCRKLEARHGMQDAAGCCRMLQDVGCRVIQDAGCRIVGFEMQNVVCRMWDAG